MNYTLHQLQIFVEVVKHQSVTKAAKEVNISQPALSIQLKKFQEQFDEPLTEVHSRRLYITDFGHSIAEIAENILREAEELVYRSKEYEGLMAGKLKISSASSGKYIMPFFTADFLHEHSGIDLELDVTNKTQVMKDLRSNKIDFAWVSTIPDDVDVNVEILLENKLYLVGDHEEFDPGIPLLYREKGSATRAAMDAYFGKEQKRKRIELTSNEAVKQAVIAGLGYSIMPLISMRNELVYKQLYIIPRKGLPMSNEWAVIWLKEKKLSKVAQAYLEYIRSHKKEIVRQKFMWYLNKARSLDEV